MDSNSKTADLKLVDNSSVEGFCPDGQHVQLVFNFTWDFFEKFDGLTCKDGLGLCNQIKLKIGIKCVMSIQPAESVRFNPNSGDGVAVVVRNDTDKNITLIFDKTIQDFGLYQNYDFNFFSVANSCTADFGDTVQLTSGDYHKVVDGDYIKYTIPYVE